MFDHAATQTGHGPVEAVTAPGPTPVVPGYAVGELVGRGGMGRVYKAKHIALGRTVAIKVLAHEPDDKLLGRFREEARAVARLQHPNIAQLYESGTADGRPFYALEFVDGGSLAEKFAGKPQDPSAAAALVETVARAVHFSHEHGILHRDLKPGNVLLAADGTPKVTDFGLAKELAASPDSSAAGLTRTGEVVGTPAYMPPEQASGVVSGLGPTADVYSLGAVLYEAVTARPPFQAADPLQTLLMVLSTDPVAPRALVPKLPRDLETICLKCLEKSPRKRYDTAAALAADLRRFLNGEPILARPVGVVERARKWAARKPAQAALVGVSAVLAAGVVAAAVWLAFNTARLAKLNGDLEAANTNLETTNTDLVKSRDETETMLGFALNTLDEHHFAIAEKLRDLPQGEKLRVEVLQQAKDTLDEMYRANPRREQVWEHLMSGYQTLGNALSQVGDADGAAVAYTRSRESAGRLAAAHPDAFTYPAHRATVGLQLATVLDIQGKAGEAAALGDEGERAAAELDAAHPDDQAVLNLCLMANTRAALRAAGAGRVEDTARAYGRWAELYRRLAKVRPDVPRYPQQAVSSELSQAGCLARMERFDEAEAILGRAKATVDALPDGGTRAVRQLRASYHDAVANLSYQRNRPADADRAYRVALVEYEALAKDFPNSPNFRRMVVTTWSAIGGVWTFGGRPDAGVDAYRTALDLARALAKDYPKDKQMAELVEQVEMSLKNALKSRPTGI